MKIQDVLEADTLQIQGYGKLEADQIKAKIRAMVSDIAEVAKEDSPESWKKLEWMMKKDTLHAFIETLNKHYKEMN